MAPEILRYEKYDAKADLWSVGAVLYEMSVGKPPFRAQNHIDLLRKVIWLQMFVTTCVLMSCKRSSRLKASSSPTRTNLILCTP